MRPGEKPGSRKETTLYRCIQGHIFDRPLKTPERIFHGEGMTEYGFTLRCPICGLGEPYFEKQEEWDGEEDAFY